MNRAVNPNTLIARDGVLFLTLAPDDRRSLAQAVDRLLTLLDAIDGDADDEASLGWASEESQSQLHADQRDEAEDENEHGGNITDEPHDPGDCGDDEPLLVWSETCGQWADMKKLGLVDMDEVDSKEDAWWYPARVSG